MDNLFYELIGFFEKIEDIKYKEENMPEILKYFEYDHLPGELRYVSKHFYELAHAL